MTKILSLYTILKRSSVFAPHTGFTNFPLRTKIKNISEAVACIGMDNLKNMIVLYAVTSICCQMVAERIFVRKGEDGFLCGLLHDISLIVKDQVAPEKFKALCRTFDPEGQKLTDHKRTVTGTDHAIIGYLLILQRGLKPNLCQGMKYHHNVMEAVEPDSHDKT